MKNKLATLLSSIIIFGCAILWFWGLVKADCAGWEDPKTWECYDIPPAVVTADSCDWIKLNTKFPIIWDCIKSKDATKAFPTMMWALAKIVVSLILVVCFILIIVAWIMRAMDKPKEWKALLIKVWITILLLWFSWVILRLINPNFFG